MLALTQFGSSAAFEFQERMRLPSNSYTFRADLEHQGVGTFADIRNDKRMQFASTLLA